MLMMVMMMIMIMIMMTMMMTIMRIKAICDVIDKSRIKITVVMIMQIELVTALKYRTLQFSALIIKKSFIALENKELHLCSGLSIMLQILYLSMASIKIGIPPSCLQKFLSCPPFPSNTFKPPPPPFKKKSSVPPAVSINQSINLLTLISEMGSFRSSESQAHV